MPPLMGGPTLAATAELAFFRFPEAMAAPHPLAKRARKKYPIAVSVLAYATNSTDMKRAYS